MSEKKTIKILVIDGGGIRGCLSLRILQELERRIHAIEKEKRNVESDQQLSHLAQKFDLVSGTSTGGIISLGLTVPVNSERSNIPGYRPADLLEIYTKYGKKIFQKSCLRSIFTCCGLSRPMYSSRGFKQISERYFKNFYLSDCVTSTLITGFAIERFTPIFFKSSMAKNDKSYDFKTKDVALATSSAPTYFKPAHIISRTGVHYYVIDGGVVVNNPAMSALVEARRLFPSHDDYLIVSIGTGNTQKSISYSSIRNRGGIGWLPHLLKIFMKGVSAVVDYQLKDLLAPNIKTPSAIRYFRFQPVIPSEISEMDDTSKETINRLLYIAESEIKEKSYSLDLIAYELTEGKPMSSRRRKKTLECNDTLINLQVGQESQLTSNVSPDETECYLSKEDKHNKWQADRYFGEL